MLAVASTSSRRPKLHGQEPGADRLVQHGNGLVVTAQFGQHVREPVAQVPVARLTGMQVVNDRQGLLFFPESSMQVSQPRPGPATRNAAALCMRQSRPPAFRGGGLALQVAAQVAEQDPDGDVTRVGSRRLLGG